VLAALLAVLAIGVNVYAVSFLDGLPSVSGLDSAAFRGDTIITDRNGAVLADIGQQGDRRVSVPLDEISPKLRDGTVAIEDRTFWTNPGFDSSAILRTLTNNFRAGGITGGASTITQQLAKQRFLSPKQTIDRKLAELVLAYRLNQTYSKQQILQFYLNYSFYGDQQYGVQEAARTYFHKDAKSVDLAQAAMLAGMPQAPDAYNPTLHFDAAKVRQKEVLDAMVRDKYITHQDAVAASAEHLDVYPYISNFLAPQFVQYVVSELQQLGLHPGQDQLTVKTTLDLGKQQLAEKTVKDNLQANLGKQEKGGKLSSALVSMDPKTGQIIAYVGSPDVNDPDCGTCDFVSDKVVNPGSSVKPFTYAKAILDRRITMDTPIQDNPSPLVLKQPNGPNYEVKNFDQRTHGTLPARVALASSYNIPAVKVEAQVGVPAVVDFYRTMGMFPREAGKKNAPSTDYQYAYSVTLGGYPITLLEEVTALSTMADMGVQHQAEALLSVSDGGGHAVYPPPGSDPNRGARQVLDQGVAFIIASILDDNNNRLPAFGPGPSRNLYFTDRHSAAKTGTSENFHDGLTIGFTPDLATVVWIGDIHGLKPGSKDQFYKILGPNNDGVFVAAPAWHAFMAGALKGVPNAWYDMPADVAKVGNSYFLKDTVKVDHLQGDSLNPSPSPSNFGIPNDPGTGPQPVNGRCPPLPVPIPACPTPHG
jgi:membrane peptidoglycan carboxypeptidase